MPQDFIHSGRVVVGETGKRLIQPKYFVKVPMAQQNMLMFMSDDIDDFIVPERFAAAAKVNEYEFTLVAIGKKSARVGMCASKASRGRKFHLMKKL